ncbi:MAG: (d)CMP kinase [Burkholderiaceae bacterium]
MKTVPVIAIDGPTASGKGTIAQQVARALRFQYLDSGALYRLVALRALQSHVDEEPDRLALIAAQIKPQFAQGRIVLDGVDVSDALRSEEVGRVASQIAVFGGVRAALVELQRSSRRLPGLVADGRDMGTVVFPDARPKIYLTASVEARAERRYKQLIEKGFSASISPFSTEQISLEAVRREIQARDQRDAQRAVSPLKPASDAYQIDSSQLTVEEVVAQVLKWYELSQEQAAGN